MYRHTVKKISSFILEVSHIYVALFACLGNLPTGGWTDFQLHLLVQRDGVTLGLVLEVRHNSPPATCIPFLPPDPNHCLKRLQAGCVLHQCQCIYDYKCVCVCMCVRIYVLCIYYISIYVSMYVWICVSVYLSIVYLYCQF